MSQSKALYPNELAEALTLPTPIQDVSDYSDSGSLWYFLSSLRQISEYYLLWGRDPLFPHFSSLLLSYDAIHQTHTDSVVKLTIN
jgi:hypothetical protein